jgi:hypothetical protein
MAVDFHHAAAKRLEFVRTTSDVNVLLTPQGLADFQRLLVPRSYGPLPGRSRRFVDRRQRVEVGVILTGSFPGYSKSGPIAFPEPQQICIVLDEIKVAELHALIEMKLAAGRHQDLGDVVSLIGSQNLDASYAARLHRSLRASFAECIEETRREEEFLRRNG